MTLAQTQFFARRNKKTRSEERVLNARASILGSDGIHRIAT